MPKLDPSIRPQDDFFGYVNNIWLRENPIPPTESMWGTFFELREKSRLALKTIIEELTAADEKSLTRDQLLLKTFFAAGQKLSEHGANHLATLDKELDEIRAISNQSQLAKYLGRAHRYDFPSFWVNFVDLDDKNSQIQVLRIEQAGLTLPNRDYYLDDTPKMANVRDAYQRHYLNLKELLAKQTPENWAAIINLETAIAKIAWTDVALRDVNKNYNPVNFNELLTRFPTFDWTAYFDGLGLGTPAGVLVIDQPSYIESVVRLISETDLEDIKAYLSWQITNSLLGVINEDTARIGFEFFGRVLSGTKEMKPIWERVIMQADALIIGEALGREYANRLFPESSKQAILGIVEDVRQAYHQRIDRLTWMSDASKQTAHRKLDKIKVFIGYPSTWHDLSNLEFKADNYLANILAARALTSDVQLDKVGKTPADEEWMMNAHTVNAYNHPSRLEIVFPAAILQPPFYHPDASYATNLGGIGWVVGHELTHGFDDQGSEFDENGNTNQWQSDEERATFKKLATSIVKQADAFEVVPGTFLQGELILGEAIADVGGLELAIEALRLHWAKNLPSAEESTEQLKQFFVNGASWENDVSTEERAIEQAKVDPHPPSRFRVNCVFGHIDSFYEVFGVTSEDKLYVSPENRSHIW